MASVTFLVLITFPIVFRQEIYPLTMRGVIPIFLRLPSLNFTHRITMTASNLRRRFLFNLPGDSFPEPKHLEKNYKY